MTKILIDRSTVEQALKALKMMGEKYGEYACPACDHADAAIDELRDRLAQPEQELVIDCPRCGHCCPQRTWQGLTDEEIDALVIDKDGLPNSHLEFARAVEAALRSKNNG